MTDLPTMTECNGCGDCCGPVAAKPDEITRIRQYTGKRGITWRPNADDPLQCGFYDRLGSTCRIYAVRPGLCRMYGVVQGLACPHFPAAATVALPPRSIRRLLPEAGALSLHEVFGGWVPGTIMAAVRLVQQASAAHA